MGLHECQALSYIPNYKYFFFSTLEIDSSEGAGSYRQLKAYPSVILFPIW